MLRLKPFRDFSKPETRTATKSGQKLVFLARVRYQSILFLRYSTARFLTSQISSPSKILILIIIYGHISDARRGQIRRNTSCSLKSLPHFIISAMLFRERPTGISYRNGKKCRYQTSICNTCPHCCNTCPHIPARAKPRFSILS